MIQLFLSKGEKPMHYITGMHGFVAFERVGLGAIIHVSFELPAAKTWKRV